MDILADADFDKDSHLLPIACDFRSPCPIMPNLRYIPWVFSEGCVGDLNCMSAYKVSPDSAVKTHRIFHQGSREKTEGQEEKSTLGNTPFFTNVRPWGGWCPENWETENWEAPWYLHLNLQSSHEAVFGGTLELLFGICSQRAYTLLDVDASFALKMRMSEQNWTKIYLITANTIKIWQEHWAIKHFRLKWNYLTIASLYVWLGNISTF